MLQKVQIYDNIDETRIFLIIFIETYIFDPISLDSINYLDSLSLSSFIVQVYIYCRCCAIQSPNLYHIHKTYAVFNVFLYDEEMVPLLSMDIWYSNRWFRASPIHIQQEWDFVISQVQEGCVLSDIITILFDGPCLVTLSCDALMISTNQANIYFIFIRSIIWIFSVIYRIIRYKL